MSICNACLRSVPVRLMGCVAGCWVLLATVFAPAALADTYTFGVVPQFEPRKMFAIWRPIIDDLARRTGSQFDLSVPLTVSEFEKELGRGTFDFVYGNPYHILRVQTKQGYVPLVRDANPLRGILLVRKDSPVRDPRELDGKTLAVPSPNALGASLIMRADLAALFGVHVKMADVKTHSSAYLNALNAVTDAAGGVEKTFAEQPAVVREGLRVIYTTREMPSHPVAAHPRVPKAAMEKVRAGLLAMAADGAGKAMLDDVPMKRPVAASIDDYLAMRSWGLDAYWVEGGM